MTDQANEGLLSPFLRKQRMHACVPYLHGKLLDVGCGVVNLAEFVECGMFIGVDSDEMTLRLTRSRYPKHHFQQELPDIIDKFDTIAALAVIEHVEAPEYFIAQLAARLKPVPGSRIILTTPHPSFERLYRIGATLGAFSMHAEEEHKALVDKNFLVAAGRLAGLKLACFKRFLVGANQLAIFELEGL